MKRPEIKLMYGTNTLLVPPDRSRTIRDLRMAYADVVPAEVIAIIRGSKGQIHRTHDERVPRPGETVEFVSENLINRIQPAFDEIREDRDNLLIFLDDAEERWMHRATAHALKTACSRVLRAQDNWPNIDFLALDAEKVLHAFEVKAHGLDQQTIETYKNRFRVSLALYRDPAAEVDYFWKSRQGRQFQRAEAPKPQITSAEYPFPIREDVVARLHLPSNLMKAEAERLCAFIRSLVTE